MLLELIAARVEVGIHVMIKLCQGVLDGLGMPIEWALGIMAPICKGNGDIYKAVKLLEHGMKVV